MLLYSTLTEISENIVPNSYKFVPHGRMLHFLTVTQSAEALC